MSPGSVSLRSCAATVVSAPQTSSLHSFKPRRLTRRRLCRRVVLVTALVFLCFVVILQLSSNALLASDDQQLEARRILLHRLYAEHEGVLAGCGDCPIPEELNASHPGGQLHIRQGGVRERDSYCRSSASQPAYVPLGGTTYSAELGVLFTDSSMSSLASHLGWREGLVADTGDVIERVFESLAVPRRQDNNQLRKQQRHRDPDASWLEDALFQGSDRGSGAQHVLFVNRTTCPRGALIYPFSERPFDGANFFKTPPQNAEDIDSRAEFLATAYNPRRGLSQVTETGHRRPINVGGPPRRMEPQHRRNKNASQPPLLLLIAKESKNFMLSTEVGWYVWLGGDDSRAQYYWVSCDTSEGEGHAQPSDTVHRNERLFVSLKNYGGGAGRDTSVVSQQTLRQAASAAKSASSDGTATTQVPLNIVMLMWDSVSRNAFLQRAPRMQQLLRDLQSSLVYDVVSFSRFHVVGCCSPGNQIPVLSGEANGEGDECIVVEPSPHDSRWLWNVARQHGKATFYATDSCADSTVREFQSQPSCDYRLATFACLDGHRLASPHTSCVGGVPTSLQALEGLSTFWQLPRHVNDSKFAWVNLVSPHETSGQQTEVVDDLTADALRGLLTPDARGGDGASSNDTVVIFWSDHGLGFGPHFQRSQGQMERLYPLLHIVLPKHLGARLEHDAQTPLQECWEKVRETLSSNQDKLVTPFDVYLLVRSLLDASMFLPNCSVGTIARDETKSNRVMQSMQCTRNASERKDPRVSLNLGAVTVNATRSCRDAGIPVSLCSCLQWRRVRAQTNPHAHRHLVLYVLRHHRLVVRRAIMVREADIGRSKRPGLNPLQCFRPELLFSITGTFSADVSVAVLDASYWSHEGLVAVARIEYTTVVGASFRAFVRISTRAWHLIDMLLSSKSNKTAPVTPTRPPSDGDVEEGLELDRMERTSAMDKWCGAPAGLVAHLCEC